MKYLKLYEEMREKSREEARKDLLENSGLLDIIYDLRDISLEYLDTEHEAEEFGEKQYYQKALLINVDVADSDDQFSDHTELIGVHYSGQSIEDEITWIGEAGKDEIEKISEGLKAGKQKFYITLGVVFGEPGEATAVGEETSEVYRRISEMHPEAEFDTFNPWDI